MAACACSPVGPADRGFPRRRVEILQALALRHRVVRQRRDAVAREVGGQHILARLARRRVPRRHHHCRERTRARGGHIHIRRHVEPRQALEHDLLDAEAIALQRAAALRIQRRARRGQSADHLEQFRAHLPLAVFRLRTRTHRRHFARPRFEFRHGERIQAAAPIGRARCCRQRCRRRQRKPPRPVAASRRELRSMATQYGKHVHSDHSAYRPPAACPDRIQCENARAV